MFFVWALRVHKKSGYCLNDAASVLKVMNLVFLCRTPSSSSNTKMNTRLFHIKHSSTRIRVKRMSKKKFFLSRSHLRRLCSAVSFLDITCLRFERFNRGREQVTLEECLQKCVLLSKSWNDWPCSIHTIMLE